MVAILARVGAAAETRETGKEKQAEEDGGWCLRWLP